MKKNFNQLKKVFGGFVLGTVLLFNFNGTILAANVPTVSIDSRELPKPQFQNKLGTFSVDFNGLNVTKEAFVKEINNYFGLDDKNSFQLSLEQSDEFGNVYYSYQHFYNNIKLEGDIVFIQVKNGKVQFVSGQLVIAKEINTSANISEEQVKLIARNHFGIKENVEEGIIESCIIKIESESDVDLVPTYKIMLTSLYPLNSTTIYISFDGKVVNEFSNILHGDTPGSGSTYYRGTQNITVDSYSGSYRLKDNARNIHTLNAANINGGVNTDGSLAGSTDFTSTTTAFTNATIKPAVDIHWGMSKTYDYFKNVHNRSGYDGKGAIIRNYYNIPTGAFGSGTPQDPGWDQQNAGALEGSAGGSPLIFMAFGTGGSIMNPVVGLDVTGHEYSHLVNRRCVPNGGLNYQGESGAIEESFADIFGVSIEWYTNLSPNWTIGEGVIKSSVTPSYMRNMANPNSAAAPAIPNQPDTYKGKYWASTTSSVDSGGVHINSGVGNFWFYLLSVGGSGTNDIGNKYYVAGITIQKAEKIAYKALNSGLSKTATYMDMYNATKNAAATLYGNNSEEWKQVVNAWYAVGIGNAPASNQNVEMETKLNVYPNPATGDEVTIESSLEEATTVEMYDLSGKQVMAPRTLEYRTTLNVANFATGMYILKFKSNLGQYSHKLMIK